MKRAHLAVLVAFVLVIGLGCATIVSGSPKGIQKQWEIACFSGGAIVYAGRVQGDPRGRRVTIDGLEHRLLDGFCIAREVGS